MKILYHHRTASKDGQAVHIEEMIDAMRSLGHEVRVVSPVVSESGAMGGKVGWVHKLKSLLPNAIYEFLEFSYTFVAYRRLLKEAMEFKPDIIYERYNLYLLAGLLLKRKLHIPLFLEVNSPLVFERSQHSGGLALGAFARWAEGTAWRGADFVLPVTEVLAGYVRDYGVPESKIFVIPNGINEDHFAKAPSCIEAHDQLNLSGRLVLGFTGFVREWHGVDRVINWLASANAPENAYLLIVGDGPVRAQLESLAKKLGVAEKVRFTGVVHRSEVPSYVAAFDIALQPAVTSYASPLKMMEYLVLGKAIVAPREPNLLEILEDGVNALMFDGQKNDGLEKALSKLCLDDALRVHLSKGAKETISRRDLTWLGNARKVISLAVQLRLK